MQDDKLYDANLNKFSDWDLVNSFVTSIWHCRHLVDKYNWPEYEKYYGLSCRLRDELLDRLSSNSRRRYAIQNHSR